MIESDYAFSVVIPYFKADDYFQSCMDSILQQSLPAQEIIIVDDCSGPESEKFLQQFEKVATIVNFESHQDIAAARNSLIAMAQYPWLAFQDADDIWETNKLELQAVALEENPQWAGCHTGVTVFDESQEIACYTEKPHVLSVSDLLLHSQVATPSLVIRKDVLRNLGGYDPRFITSSDYEMTIRVVEAGYKIGFVSQPLVRVRRARHGNISSNGIRTFNNHRRLVVKHRKLFMKRVGIRGILRFLGQSLREASSKQNGIVGKMMHGTGRILSWLE